MANKNNSFPSNLEDMIKANYPLIYLTTTEYSRVKQIIRKFALKNQYEFHSWNNVLGLQTHQKTPNDSIVTKQHPHDTKDYNDLLNGIRTTLDDTPDKEVYYLEDFHRYFEQPEAVSLLRHLAEKLKAHKKHLLLVGPYCKLPNEIEKYVTMLHIPLPDRRDLGKRLDVVLAGKNLHEDLKKHLLDAALGMTDMEAELAFKLAEEKVGLDKKEAARIIANEKEQIIKKSGILDYFQVHEDLDKTVGGLDKLKTWLKQRSKAFESNAQNFGLKEPKGILLLGVPGCGKSLTAKCIASLWQQPLLRLDVGKVFQAEVGASENNIRQAIATAEAVAPCILWIDEIEKGLNVGGGEQDGGTNSRVFSTILTWMQEKTKPVFVVATANKINNLPPELLRKGRFDEIFFVDLPTFEERQHIFKIHLEKNGKEDISNLEELAEKTKYFNGAEIEEVVKEALFIAYTANENQPVLKSDHIIEAIQPIVPLAQTMRDQISGLREWATNRARPASAATNTEKIEKRGGILQTKREKEENIFG